MFILSWSSVADGFKIIGCTFIQSLQLMSRPQSVVKIVLLSIAFLLTTS